MPKSKLEYPYIVERVRIVHETVEVMAGTKEEARELADRAPLREWAKLRTSTERSEVYSA